MFCIGYMTLENWLNSIDKEQPVYACLITEPGQTGQYAQRLDKLVVLVSQPESDDIVHYCRLNVASLQYIGDSPYNDHKRNVAQAEQAWLTIQAWLNEQGLDIREGVISMTQNINLVDGWAVFLNLPSPL